MPVKNMGQFCLFFFFLFLFFSLFFVPFFSFLFFSFLSSFFFFFLFLFFYIVFFFSKLIFNFRLASKGEMKWYKYNVVLNALFSARCFFQFALRGGGGRGCCFRDILFWLDIWFLFRSPILPSQYMMPIKCEHNL